MTEQHAGIRHTVAGSKFNFPLAVARHRLRGGKEQLEVLRGLDLHPRPCASLVANRRFYAIAVRTYNLMKAVPLLCLPGGCQGWTVPTLLKRMVRLPAMLVRQARRLVARVEVAASWLDWWQPWQARWWRAGAAEAAAPSG